MALAYASWVSETGTLTGTDPTYTLPNTASPASGNQFLRTLGAAFTAASDVILTISNSSGAETSIWTFTPGASGAAGTIQRVQLIESSTGAAINWSGQTVTIGLEIPAPVNVSAGAASEGRIPFLGSSGVFDGSVLTEILPSQKTGNWYTSFSTGFTSGTLGNSQLYFTPIWIPQDHVYQQIGIQSQSSSLSQATTISLGLALDAGGVPSTSLFYDAGQVTIPTNTNYGSYALSISGAGVIPRGIIWSIIGTDTVAGTAGLKLWQLNSWLIPTMLGFTSPSIGNVNNPPQGYFQSWTPGASLPSNFSSFSNAPNQSYAFNAWIQA